MLSQRKYFFCGIGGSGMLPLAIIMKGQGADIYGSDRSHDQGRNPEKFKYIEDQGIKISPQDGSGLTKDMTLVVSSAIEDSIPEVKKAKENNIKIVKRAELLASLFNKAQDRIAVAGTSGKSTTTGMIGYILHEMGREPTVMNGAVFRNFVTEENAYATALSGDADLFITEADESDGSIALYDPTIAVLNNLSLDHKSVEELRELFGDFIAKAETAILNLDNDEVARLATESRDAITYSLKNPDANYSASEIKYRANGVDCIVNKKYHLNLSVPGKYNVSNALAALATIHALGLDVAKACQILSGFKGVKRRMEVIGSRNNITVIDDFAHNPDKIEASLQALKEFPGRLLIMFQMHGFGTLKLMHKELAESFIKYLSKDDVIFMPEVLYLGGTVDRTYTEKDLIRIWHEAKLDARWFKTRSEIEPAIVAEARPGDRIIIMGARDDTLPEFARAVLNRL